MTLIRVQTDLGLRGLLTKVRRSAAGLLFFPEYDALLDPRNNCLALLTRPNGERLLVPAENIVTDAGDIFVAQLAAGVATTDTFTFWGMASAGTPGKAATRATFTPIASSELVQDATYPKVVDDDADNTGDGVDTRTTRRSYSAASFNHAAITHAFITNSALGASEPLLTGFAWSASINKTASDTLKVFHNMTMNGV